MTAHTSSLYQALLGMELFDAHTHLVGGRLGARELHDILLYHMAVSDLHGAGCPSGKRLTEFPGEPDEAEAHQRIREALPFLPQAEATSTSWAIRIILGDLYDWREPLSESNWRRLDAMIRERADDRAWHREILKRAAITGACTEVARRGNGADDDFFRYSLEWAFFTRCQWGENDTALYELERCWGQEPGPPAPITASGRPSSVRAITTLEDVHAALSWYLDHIPDYAVSVATHLSTDIAYRPVSESEMRHALDRRAHAGPEERDIYANYINEAFLSGLAKMSKTPLFQFSLGAEPLPFETGSRLNQTTLADLAGMVSRHPGLKFQCFCASSHANQGLCTLCRELPNLSLAGYWWHNFFPAIITQIMSERMDMLPMNQQVGFFSDAYCVEWAYAKSIVVRRLLASVLSEKISQGQMTEETSLKFAQTVLRDTGRHFANL